MYFITLLHDLYPLNLQMRNGYSSVNITLPLFLINLRRKKRKTTTKECNIDKRDKRIDKR